MTQKRLVVRRLVLLLPEVIKIKAESKRKRGTRFFVRRLRETKKEWRSEGGEILEGQ